MQLPSIQNAKMGDRVTATRRRVVNKTEHVALHACDLEEVLGLSEQEAAWSCVYFGDELQLVEYNQEYVASMSFGNIPRMFWRECGEPQGETVVATAKYEGVVN